MITVEGKGKGYKVDNSEKPYELTIEQSDISNIGIAKKKLRWKLSQ